MLSTKDELKEQILKNGVSILKAWIGPDDIKRQILAVLLAGKSLLLEGPPGSGKTLIARELAKALPSMEAVNCDFNCHPEKPSCPQCTGGSGGLLRRQRKGEIVKVSGYMRFIRIQGSPEITAEDLVGDIDPVLAFKHGPFDVRAFKPGKIIKANRKIIFVDEINRISERLQNSLLQMLQEGVMTIGGYDLDFPIDMVFIATMNPEEHTGVYRLSEALRDRLEIVKIYYPSFDEEVEIVDLYGEQLGAKVPTDLKRKMVEIVHGVRNNKEVEQQASVRASLTMFAVSQSFALLRGREIIEPEDVKDAAKVALRGRLHMSPDSRYFDQPESFVENIVNSIIGVA